MRDFETGATRNDDATKLDYEGFLSPSVLRAFAEYMHEHRLQADGKLRPADNWQKGMPKDVYMKSAYRHFMDMWLIHRGQETLSPETGKPVVMQDALTALMFNVMGYLHEELKTDTGMAKNIAIAQHAHDLLAWRLGRS